MGKELVRLALVAETVLAVWTAYVAYRWFRVSRTEFGPFADLVPFKGAFDVVVVPWLFGLAVIPACWVVLSVADRVSKRHNAK